MTKARDLANASSALSAVSATELGYVDGVTSAIQTQLDAKLASSTAATTYVANALADAKGDIFVASADNTVTRLAVGSTGETIVADSSTSTGLRYGANYAAGKNKIINGDFGIWQRGATFSSYTGGYTADRWTGTLDTSSASVTRQAFTAGTAPVAGYEGQYFMRFTRGTGGTFCNVQTRVEDVRTFAGQTVTLSFWAKASASCTIEPYYIQSFGSGGSGDVSASFGTSTTLTTSWVRYSYTVAIPSVSGKTIGTGSYLAILTARITSGTNVDVDTWGVQLEAGSVATSFQTATGTIQGELAACQRYYWLIAGGAANLALSNMSYYSATDVRGVVQYPVTMRTTPSVVSASGTNYFAVERNGTTNNLGFLSATRINSSAATIYNQTTASGTAGWAGYLITNDAAASLAFSAEL